LNIVIEKGLPPSAAIVKRRNYFFEENKKPINFPIGLKNLNTKTVRPIFEFANALYFFSRSYFLKNERYWDWSTVNLIELEGSLEFIDVDNEEDFILAEAVWKELHKPTN
jgi:CMP-N-acetylneuraminic acid synthetase